VTARIERESGGYDAYREIHVMQTFAGNNNLNVLNWVEALEDDDEIYIVMPHCESLFSSIPQGGFAEDQACRYMQQIIENLIYVHGLRICHADLSLDHCMVYGDRVVLGHFDHAFQLPPNATHVHRPTPHGDPAYQPPEVWEGLVPYNAYGCDVWAAAVTLFNLLTGLPLYRVPTVKDICFKFFIWARALVASITVDSVVVWNELIAQRLEYLANEDLRSNFFTWARALAFHDGIDVLRGLNENEQQDLLLIWVRLHPWARPRVIFSGAFRMNPNERWDLNTVAASSFMNPPMNPPI
jgi:serine/threonine protein kinase